MSSEPAATLTANDIAAHFSQEREAIERQLERATQRLTISSDEVSVLFRAAAQVGLDVEDHAVPDIQRLHALARQLKPEIDARLKQQEPRLEDLEEQGPKADAHRFESELIAFFRDALRDGDSIDSARASALVQAEENRREMGEDWPYSEPDLLSMLDRAAREAEFQACAEDLNDLNYASDVVDDVEAIWSASEGDTILDVQRQAFVMLMAAFDVAVFGLVRRASSRLAESDDPQRHLINEAMRTGSLEHILSTLHDADIVHRVHIPEDDDWIKTNRVCTDVVEQIRAWVTLIESRRP